MTLKSAKFGLVAVCLAVPAVWAAEFGTVVSSTPVLSSVPVSERQCFDEPVVHQRPGSGGGALIGALAGAAIGNAAGGGAGRAAATGIGMVTGAALGDHIEANNAPPVTRMARQCLDVMRYETRNLGYDVVYDYQGVRRSVRLAQEPGSRIPLDVSVTPIGAGAVSSAPVYMTPADTVYMTLADTVYLPAPPQAVYAPPVVFAAAYGGPVPLVYLGAYRGWGGHGHWR
jgi:uncharacterized protein YcfJ